MYMFLYASLNWYALNIQNKQLKEKTKNLTQARDKLSF